MRYINKLFAFDDRQVTSNSSKQTTGKLSTKLTSTLYSVIFEPEEFNFLCLDEAVGIGSKSTTTTTIRERSKDKDNSNITIAKSKSSSSPPIYSVSYNQDFCRVNLASGLARESLPNHSADKVKVVEWGIKLGNLLDQSIRRLPSKSKEALREESFECQCCTSLTSTSTLFDQQTQSLPTLPLPQQLGNNYYNHNVDSSIRGQSSLSTSVADTTLIEEDDWVLIGDFLPTTTKTTTACTTNCSQAKQLTKATTTTGSCCNRAHLLQIGNRPHQSERRVDHQESNTSSQQQQHQQRHKSASGKTREPVYYYLDEQSLEELRQMALDEIDLKLIKASWIPVRKDPVAAGVLLFKGLFTKFPQYLDFFPQFSDLDLERMHENKRLLRHATKVLDTVGFLVDSIGDESKTQQLNEALNNLVQSHLRRKIGLTEFRNLGIVLIDFICDVNHRRDISCSKASSSASSFSSSSSSASAALADKLITDSGGSGGDCINYNRTSVATEASTATTTTTTTTTTAADAASASIDPNSTPYNNNSNNGNIGDGLLAANNNPGCRKSRDDDNDGGEEIDRSSDANSSSTNNSSGGVDSSGKGPIGWDPNQNETTTTATKIDTKGLVAAWTKLYGSILDLVRRSQIL